MLRASIVALVLAVLPCVAVSTATAQDAGTGTVRGTIFWDRDADGARDEGEPPLLNLGANLMEAEGTGVFASSPNSPDGAYSITFAAGTYRIVPSVNTGTGICVDAFSGSFGPFSPSNCYGGPFPYYVQAPAEPFDLEAGETITIDLPVRVRDEMIFSLRAVEEDHYLQTGDVITAMVNGKACGQTTWGASMPPGQAEDDVSLLVDGDGSADGCARAGDPVTFVLHGVTALNEPVPYAAFDPFAPVPSAIYHIHTLDLVFAEHHAWTWSDDVHAFDGGTINVDTRIAAVVNGRECAYGKPYIAPLAAPGTDQLYGFGPIFIADTTVEGGCARDGDTIEFRINQTNGELIATAAWHPGLIELTSIVVQHPPRPIGDPAPITATPTTGVTLPNTGAGVSMDGRASSARDAVIVCALVSAVAASVALAAHVRRRAK